MDNSLTMSSGDWIQTVSAFIAIAAASLSWLSARASEKAASVKLSNDILKEIQQLNYAVMTDLDFCRFVRQTHFPDKEEDWVRLLYLTFYRLNVVHEAWIGRSSNLIKRQHSLYSRKESVALIMKTAPDQLNYILNNPRGYSSDFKKYINEIVIFNDNIISDG